MEVNIINDAPVEETSQSITPEELEELKTAIYNVLQKGYQTQDYVRAISVAPEFLTTVQEWVESFDLPDVVRQLLTIEEGDPSIAISGMVTQTQVEMNWFKNYFRNHPITTLLQQTQAPIMLGYSDFKMLYLMQLWDEAKTLNKGTELWRPGK